MKSIRSIYILIPLMILWFIICSSVETQAEVSYLGEYCVVDNSPLGRPPLPLYKIGVLSYGDNHYALNGTLINFPGAVVGSGMIDGNNFVATLTSSYVDDINGPSYTVSYIIVDMQESFSMWFGSMTSMTTTYPPMIATYPPNPPQSVALQIPIYVVSCNP